MKLPYYHIYQCYINPETEKETTKEIANAQTLQLAESILLLLEEKLSELGDPCISFKCIKSNEHSSITEH